MEPVTIICYLLTYSMGYFIGADFYNFYKLRENFRELRDDLNDIKSVLNEINYNIKNSNKK
jgi:uncharacterized phage infection (PIP) family protein YhgE